MVPLGNGVNALSGLYLISTRIRILESWRLQNVSMPSRAYTSFLPTMKKEVCRKENEGVNALSGLYLISTLDRVEIPEKPKEVCQCPLGLIPHFYGTPSKT